MKKILKILAVLMFLFAMLISSQALTKNSTDSIIGETSFGSFECLDWDREEDFWYTIIVYGDCYWNQKFEGHLETCILEGPWHGCDEMWCGDDPGCWEDLY